MGPTPNGTMRIASILMPIVNLAPLVFVVSQVPANLTFAVWCFSFGITVPVLALYFASEFPTYMQILPQERYGQFCSANAMARSLAVVVGGVIGGASVDLIKPLFATPDHAFRLIPIWVVALQSISAVSFWMLHAGWEKRGGREGYTPPAVS